jgi:hypothetical protein
MKNLEETDFWKEASAETGTHIWCKEQRPATGAMTQEGIHQDLQENHQTGDCEANCQVFCWVVKVQELDVVKGSAPSEMEEEPTTKVSVGRARIVRALTLWIVSLPQLE